MNDQSGPNAGAEPAPSFSRIAPYYDDLMQDVPYAIWLEFILSLSARHGVHPTRILDLACGTGTISLMLAVRGYQVVGIDGSEPMLEVARRKESISGAHVEFIRGDLRSFEAPGAFDLVICLYDSLNNILEPEGIQQAFQAVSRSLAPDGLFIFDVNTEYAFRANLFTQENRRPQARVQYRWRSQYDYSSRICTVDMEFWVAEGGIRLHFSELHRQRAYSQAELDNWLEMAGLTPLASYDGTSFRPPRPHTDRLYCVARRIPLA